MISAFYLSMARPPCGPLASFLGPGGGCSGRERRLDFDDAKGVFSRLARHAWRRAQAWARPFAVPIFYDPLFRLPLPSASLPSGLELRRADYVAWYLLEGLKVGAECFHAPHPAGFAALLRAHTPALIESLLEPETLAAVFTVHPSEVSVDDVLGTIRTAVGATVEGTRLALRRKRSVLSLLGGFHHAGRDRMGPLCPVNDIAIAVADARARGFDGKIVVLDLDAHPPDGTADCFADDDDVWIGSLSGSDWGELPGRVDETVLAPGTGDRDYLRALDELLLRVPDAELVYVIAGGDVLAGDGLGALGLTPDGVRERDRRLAHAVSERASVWLPGGGYTPMAWRILAGTALVLGDRGREAIEPGFDPLAVHYGHIQAKLGRDQLTDDELTIEDLGLDLGGAPAQPSKLLGFWTVSGLEFALERYGVFEQIRRLGYRHLRVRFDRATVGERMQILGTALGEEHLLVELVVEVRTIADQRVLFVNWMTMRNPRAKFTEVRPRLPGQDVPGLGLGREAAFLIAGMATRLGLAGAAFRPAWFHMAHIGRHTCRFVDPGRQGRFEALVRDLGHLSLLEATQAVADKRVFLDGEPYEWEADDMVMGLDLGDRDREQIAAERERAHFTMRTP